MLVKKANMLDISHLTPKAVSCFLAGSIAGRDIHKTDTERRMLTMLVRLIDKAINEYNFAKEAIELEEVGIDTIYSCTIIDHLENCITTLARIIKIKEKYLKHPRNTKLIDIRDSIEHIDERIKNPVSDPPTINISEDSLTIEIAARGSGKVSLKTADIAKEIITQYKDIREML